MSNPGDFRIELADAKSEGVSDPRNGALMKMFNLIDVGERAGSGIPSIYHVWKQQGWSEPIIKQTYSPNRTTLSMPLSPISDKRPAIKIGEKNPSAIKAAKRQMIIDYLTDHAVAKASEISEYIDLKTSRVRDYLAELIADGIVVAEGRNKNRTYMLKS